MEVGNYSEVPLRLLFRGKVIYQSLSDFGRHVRLCQMAFRILRTALLIVLGWPHHIGLTFPIFVSLGGMEIFPSLGTEKCNFVGLAGYTTVSAA